MSYGTHFTYRTKPDIKTAKKMLVIGTGFQHIIYSFFWYPPIASVRQCKYVVSMQYFSPFSPDFSPCVPDLSPFWPDFSPRKFRFYSSVLDYSVVCSRLQFLKTMIIRDWRRISGYVTGTEQTHLLKTWYELGIWSYYKPHVYIPEIYQAYTRYMPFKLYTPSIYLV